MSAIPTESDRKITDRTAFDERRAVVNKVRSHREMLILALLAAVAAPLLRVYPPDRVGFRWSSNLMLPPLCVVREWCGFNCPGCGMTRSFVYLAQGDFAASWHMHRIGGLLAFLVLMQIPYRLLAMRRPQRPILPAVVTRWIGPVLVALLLLNWIYNLLSA